VPLTIVITTTASRLPHCSVVAKFKKICDFRLQKKVTNRKVRPFCPFFQSFNSIALVSERKTGREKRKKKRKKERKKEKKRIVHPQ